MLSQSSGFKRKFFVINHNVVFLNQTNLIQLTYTNCIILKNRNEGTLGSKATGEPAMLMGCSVAFAIRNALRAGREELGITGDGNIPNWVNICKTPLIPYVDLYLISEKSSLKNQVRRTGFLTCKNQFQN